MDATHERKELLTGTPRKRIRLRTVMNVVAALVSTVSTTIRLIMPCDFSCTLLLECMSYMLEVRSDKWLGILKEIFTVHVSTAVMRRSVTVAPTSHVVWLPTSVLINDRWPSL